MRKILLTLFAMVVTASLQAITILWTLPDSNPSNSWVQTVMGNPKQTDDTLGLYLVYSESGYDTAEEVWSAARDKSDNKPAKYVAGSTVGGVSSTFGTGVTDNTPAPNVSFGFMDESTETSVVITIDGTTGFGTTGNYYLVVFDPASSTSDSNAQYAVAQAKTFSKDNGFYQTTVNPNDQYLPPDMGDFVDLKWMGGHWPAVPEPTALALLALGVAGLALRRKI